MIRCGERVGRQETALSLCEPSYLHNMQAPVQNANSVSPNQNPGKTQKAFCLALESLSGNVHLISYHYLLFSTTPREGKTRKLWAIGMSFGGVMPTFGVKLGLE